MKTTRYAFFLLVLFFATIAAAEPVKVYVAKTVLTLDAKATVGNAVAVENGRIVAAGQLEVVRNSLPGKQVEMDTRFANDVIVPGFIEPHSHFQWYGLYADVPYVGYYDRLRPDGTTQPGAKNPDEVLARLRIAVAESAKSDPARPVFAYGADPIYFGGRHFDAAFLDRVSKETPILIQLASGHIVICNTPMLKIVREDPGWAGIEKTNAVVRDAFGQPTGELDEIAAVSLAVGAFSKLNPEVFVNPGNQMRALQNAGKLMQRAGVTMATDHFFGGPSKLGEEAMHEMYALATSRSDFPVRVQLVYDGAGLVQNWGGDAVQHMKDVKSRDTDKLRTGMIKFTLDGSVQGYTAQISPGSWNGAGNPIWNVTEAQFLEYGTRFWDARFPLKVHVNGELSVEALLNGLAVLQRQSPWPDHRTTFEHCPAVTPEQYQRIRAGATVNLFANHIDYWGEQHYTITLGPKRADAIASTATAKSLKIPYSFHSDAPITPSAPLFAIWAAVNRTTRTGGVLGQDQKIPALDALRAVTSGAAYLLRMENEIGSIERGKRADLTVLADNPLTVPADSIRNIPVRATMLGGQVFPVPPAP